MRRLMLAAFALLVFGCGSGGERSVASDAHPVSASTALTSAQLADSTARERPPLQIGPVVPVLDVASESLDFAEGIAVSPRGNLYVGRAISGKIMKVGQSGDVSVFAALPSENDWSRLLLGLAVDCDETVYAALTDYVGDQGGLWKVTQDGHSKLVMPMPTGSVPNAIAFDPAGNIYVTESSGSIWRLGVDGSQGRPWAQDPLLAAASAYGANGIAHRDGALWVLNFDLGTIVRVPITRGGAAGVMTVFVASPALVGGDGGQFDATGNLWVGNSNTSELLRVSPDGVIDVAVTADEFQPFWSTTNPVFGFGRDRQTLFITGVLWDPDQNIVVRPAVVEVRVGRPGMALPQLSRCQ